MAMTVTATQTGSTANGLALRVYVLTGAAAAGAQTGSAVNAAKSSTTAWTLSIANSAGSAVYAAASAGSSSAGIGASGSNMTLVDNIADSTNGETYWTAHVTGLTAGTTTRGITAGSASSGPLALLEILASGTIAEDGSSPAVASTTSATTVTTASFTPPAGSLLVALIASDGGTGVTNYSMSNTGPALSWSQKSVNNPSVGDYAGIWIADGPSATVTPGLGVLSPPSWVTTVAGYAGPRGAGHSR